MKRISFLVNLTLLSASAAVAQNVFDPNDNIVRYDPSAAYGTISKPDSNITGLQKWVASSTNGVSSGTGSFQVLSETYKAYFFRYYGVRLTLRVKYPKSFLNPDSTGKKYPVALFLHGAGEVACPSNGGIYNNEKQLVHGGKLFAQRVDNNQFDGFLVYPQLRAEDNGCWGAWGVNNSNYNTMFAFIDSMAKYAKADIDRVFVFGLSGGGTASWRIAESYPTRVASVAPTSAAGLPLNNAAFIHIPVWLATGGKDTNPTPAMALYSETKINELGGSIRRSLYPDLGHSSWDRHWAEADFVPFMNSAHKANPLVFFNRSEFCPGTPISAKIGISAGFAAYEWEKDGVLIATRSGTTNTVIDPSSIQSFTGNEMTVKAYGTYRVRFKRTTTSSWSDWSLKPAVIKAKPVTQTSPIQVNGMRSKVLPSLDGKTTAQLQLAPNFQDYEWRRVSDNVVVSTAQVYEAPVGTYKARYAEPNGCGTEYSPEFKVVNASGSPKPDAAKNLNVTVLSQTALRLDWADNPNAGTNETGFEIYRSLKAGGPYTLLHITAPNIVTYQDINLIPNTNYYYKVRAVSETGAAAASDEAEGKTEIDNQSPTAPADLEYRGSTSTTISLRWKASTDNAAIARYDIYVNGQKLYSTTSLAFTVANLDSLVSYTIFVKAVDKAGNSSSNSNQIIAYTHRQGLNYKYYHGNYGTLPDFATLTPEKTGITDTVNFGNSIRTRADQYAFLWEGMIYIPVTGTYTFETASDDGSKLYLDVPYSFSAAALVNNDGAHGVVTKTGTRYLTQGYHSIAITYSESGGGEEMTLYWSNTSGLARERIPKRFFSIGDATEIGTLNAPASLVASAAGYNKISLTWTDNSADETGFEVVRSSTINGSYVPVFTTPANAVSYTDSGLTAATKYFYKVRAVKANAQSSFGSAFTEANWKFNNNYSEENGGASAVQSNMTFGTDRVEGSHSIVFSNNSNVTIGGGNAFPSTGGYSQRTVAVWIKPAATDNKRIIFEIGGADNGLGLCFNNNDLIGGIASGSVRYTVSLPAFASNTNWLAGQWNHVALVYNINALSMYVNGVEVAMNNSLAFTTIGNSSSPSRLGSPNGVVFNDGSYVNYLGSMDNLYIVRGALTSDEINTIRSGTFMQSAATTSAAPASPATPGTPVVKVLSTSAIELKFADNSANENGFEIWRSSGDKTNNRKIATISSSDASEIIFQDTTLFANVTYYYKIRATGILSTSAFTSEASGKTLNSKPVVKKIKNFTMRYGTTFTLPITATDKDGDALAFTMKTIPVFATTQNPANGQFNITFSPPVSRIGNHAITVYVQDANGGRDTTTFTLGVNVNDVPVLAPIQEEVTVSEGAQIAVPVSATDNNGFTRMIWSFDGLPSFATFTDNKNGTGSLSFKPGYSSAGEYEVTVYINDGYNAWTSRTVKLTVSEKDPEETLQFNFRSTSAPVLSWNSVDILPPGFSHGAILDAKLNPNSASLSLVRGNITTSSQGPQTGNNSGVYPDLIMKDIMLWGFNAGNNAVDTLVLKVSGLDTMKRYSFTFYSGYRLNGDVNSTTRFRIGGQEVSINYYMNTSISKTIEGALPNSAGEILVTMIGDPNTSRGGVLNAMVINASFDDGSIPAKPGGLTGTHVQNEGVRLNWNDIAFNETAYRVFRASQKSGPYTVLNEGSVNKDSTIYVDNTVSPEATYYYYVAGVNAAGTGVSSDSIKVITGNNKPVINSADAVYLKAHSTTETDFTVTDDTGDVVEVTVDQKPSFITLLDMGGNNYRLVASPAADHVGRNYTMTLKAADNRGGVSTRNIAVSVADKYTRSVYVNFGSATKTAPSPWNNWLGMRGAGNTLLNLKDEKNAATSFSVTTVNSWSGVNDLGHMTGTNGGVFSDSVLRSGISDGTSARTIRFNGLNNAMRYNIIIVSSMNEGINSNVEYVSGLVRDTLNAKYNTNRTANLNGLAPVGGEISFLASRLSGTAVSYLNAIVLEEYDPSLDILGPINLAAEPNDRTSVNLIWSDRASNENLTDGYLLETATDPAFNSNVTVKALVANTTEYRVTGLQPNTKYWFRVRAKSALGTLSEYSNRATAITPSSIVYVNFNYSLDNADLPWNNTFAPPTAEATFDTLFNQAGNTTGLQLELTKIFNGEFTAGVNTGNNSGMVSDKVLASNYWLDNTQLSQFRLTGLNHSKRYRIGFFGSSSSTGWVKGNYTATYTINGTTVYLNSWMNSSKVVYIDGVMPDGDGSVLLDFSTTAEAAYGFNGGIIIEDYTDPESIQTVVVNNSSLLSSDTASATNSQTAVAAVPQRRTSMVNGKMYPNPVVDFMNINFNNLSASDVISTEVYDLSGRLTYRKNFGKMPAGDNTLRINVKDAGMGVGVYIVTLSVNGKTVQAGKVIKSGRP